MYADSRTNLAIHILGIGLIFIIIISMLKSMQNSTYTLSFTGFLDYLSHAPLVKPSLAIGDFIIKGSWGIFDGFRQFLNFITTGFGALLYVSELIIRAINYIIYFASFIFATP